MVREEALHLTEGIMQTLFRGSPFELQHEKLRRKQCSPSTQVIKSYKLDVNSGSLSLKNPSWLWYFSCKIFNFNI